MIFKFKKSPRFLLFRLFKDTFDPQNFSRQNAKKLVTN